MIDIDSRVRYESTEGSVVGVDVWSQEFGEEIGFFMGCGSGADFAVLFYLARVAGFKHCSTSQRLLFCLKRLRKVVEEWVESGVERDVVEDCEDEEDYHAN